jgi:hypothetical protein
MTQWFLRYFVTQSSGDCSIFIGVLQIDLLMMVPKTGSKGTRRRTPTGAVPTFGRSLALSPESFPRLWGEGQGGGAA